MLTIRLPEDIEARLDLLAKRTGRSKTFYAREAIVEHLEALEDIYLAEKVLKRIQSGKEKVRPMEQVKFGTAWLAANMKRVARARAKRM